jgi:hypothetical protein
VTGSADPTADLGPVVRALADRPQFLAGWVAATPDANRLLRATLHLDEQALERLLVCRAPRPQQFSTDVSAVAEYVGIDATSLAAALRSVTTLAALSTSAPAGAPALTAGQLLAAARDTAVELLPATESDARIERLAATTWATAPRSVREQRDVAGAIAWASPVMVVTLPRLELAVANQWLAEHGVSKRLDGGADPLRGLLVAWRGHGVVFIDGTLEAAERRFNLAHEHGHFLVDYAEPRRRVARDVPGLLEVLDGHRAATTADRAAASLARVPLGLHTHLLRRDAESGTTAETGAAEDDASRYALELIAPVADLTAVLRAALPADLPYRDMLAVATDLVARHFDLPTEPASARAKTGLAALDIRPGFFDR